MSRESLRGQEVHDQEGREESSGEVPGHCLSIACRAMGSGEGVEDGIERGVDVFSAERDWDVAMA